jgi:hypothetical protein
MANTSSVAEKFEVLSETPPIQWKERGQLLDVEDEVRDRLGNEKRLLDSFQPVFVNALPTSEKCSTLQGAKETA